MKRRTIILISVGGFFVLLATLALIFGPYIYRDVIVGDVPDTPTVTVASSDTSTSAITAESATGTWKVVSDSYAGYRVDEVLRGVDVTVVGRTSDVSGEITIADSNLTSGIITVDVATIATTEPSRDSYFRSNVIESRKFPTATFTLNGPLTIPDSAFTDKKGSGEIKGTLTLHGVTREVTIAIKAGYDGARAQIAGSVPVSWSDYDMTTPSLGFVEVEKNGFIEFSIYLERA